MASRHREVETKLEPPAAAELPDLVGIDDGASVEDPVEHRLEAEYFDTQSLSLAAAGISLRRRTGGDDDGWHLKLPADGGARDELRLPLDAAGGSVPEALRDAVLLHTGDELLAPVARLRTRRRVHRLIAQDGRVLLEVADDSVTSEPLGADKDELAVSWREWEAELVDGDQRHLDAVVERLALVGAAPADHRSKLARALGDRLPERSEASTRDLDGTAGAVVLARLREQQVELRRQDPLVRLDQPGSVHRMRVAVRRLRSALSSFRPLLERAQTDPLREELRWIAGLLGEARDAEVLRQRLAELIAAEPVELVVGPVAQHVDDDLRGRYRDAHGRAVEAMRSPRYRGLIDRLQWLVELPAWTARASRPAEEVLLPLVRRELKRTRRRLAAADEARDGATREERLHDARKAAKRARYAAEALAPIGGEQAERLAKALARLQSLLGDHHDAIVAQPELRRLGMRAHLDGENAFTYGLLTGREHARAQAAESELERAWARASAKRLRRWLR